MPKSLRLLRDTRSSAKTRSESASEEQEANETIMETECVGTSQQELADLRAQLQAAMEERQERQRLEVLLREQQSAQPTPAVVTSTPAAVISSATVTNVDTVISAPTNSKACVAATEAFGMNVPSSVATIEGQAVTSVATAATHVATSEANTSMPFPTFASNGASVLPRASSTQVTSRVAYSPYSWPPPAPPLLQPSQSTASACGSETASRIPTFLQPLNALQTFEPRYFEPHPASLPAQRPTTSPGSFGNHRKLHDLPEFHGKSEEWPMFCMAFVESTNMFQYSKLENMFRLQRCLRGQAKDVVESLLIHPNNVEQVMSTLEFRFGRPECLVQSQLRKVRETGQISESKVDLIVEFATKVQNLTAFLEASGMHQYLMDPLLLDELIGKLPMSRRLEWAQSSMLIQPCATIKHFSEWLNRLSRIICLATTTSLSLSSQARSEARPRTRRVLHADRGSISSDAVSDRCRHCKERRHPITECSSFKNLNSLAKWEFAKTNKLCCGCLRRGHGMRTCRSRRVCTINGCSNKHHQLLHEEEPRRKVDPNISACEQGDVQKHVLSCKRNGDAMILFRVVPVRVYNGDITERTYAMFDEGSSVTMISSNLARRLQLRGTSKMLNLRWFGSETLCENSSIVDVQISSDRNKADRFNMCEVQMIEELNLPMQTFIASEFDLRHLQKNASAIAEYTDAKPEILIGLDNCHLGVPTKSIKMVNGAMIASLTKLGWVVYGRAALITHSQDKIVLCNSLLREQDLHSDSVIEDYFKIENFGVKKPKENLVSDDDKRALMLLSTTTVSTGDRYSTGLL